MKLEEFIKLDEKRPLIFTASDENITSLYEQMKRENVSQIAVMRSGAFVGLVDFDGILQAVMLSPQHFHSLEAQDIMKGNLPRIEGANSVEDVLNLMSESNHKALPYYLDGECVSLITQTDLMVALDIILRSHQSKIGEMEAKGELFMANPLVQRIMSTLSDLGI